MEKAVIYVAGCPDAYPVEFYNAETGAYEGVIPQLLRRFSQHICRLAFPCAFCHRCLCKHAEKPGCNQIPNPSHTQKKDSAGRRQQDGRPPHNFPSHSALSHHALTGTSSPATSGIIFPYSIVMRSYPDKLHISSLLSSVSFLYVHTAPLFLRIAPVSLFQISQYETGMLLPCSRAGCMLRQQQFSIRTRVQSSR